MTTLEQSSTDDIVKELGTRCNEFLLVRVEGDIPQFTAMGSPFLLAGLIHAAELLNNGHVIRAIQESTESKLKIANGPIPPPPHAPGS